MEDGQAMLTQAQRERMQRNRDEAIARRNARLSASPQSVSHCSACPQSLSKCSYTQGSAATDDPPEVIEVEFCGSRFRYFRAEPITDRGRSSNPARELLGDFGPSQGTLDDRAVNNEEVILSEEQREVLWAVADKKSVFVTGSAGTGKSLVIQYAIRVLMELYGPAGVYVTASTGIAACALSGTTLHSFAGVGLGTYSQERLLLSILKNNEKKRRWRDASALVIDEISMIDAELFDKIDYIGQQVRGSSKPFGGLQLVVTGDFYQLPPVEKAGEAKGFAFNAKCWSKCFDVQIELTHVFRQEDREFVDMLNEIRRGRCSPKIHQRLLACTNPSTADGIALTKLYPLRRDVDHENDESLHKLRRELVTFRSKDTGRLEALKGARAPKEVNLAVGAQVMLIKNLDPSLKLVNGSRGVIVDFVPPERSVASQVSISEGGGLPVVRFEGGKVRVMKPDVWTVMDGEEEIASRVQIPLVLAWALSVHKCQGMTLNRVQIDLSRSFEYGMIYVALSRVRSLDGLKLLGFDSSRIKVHPQVVQFYEDLKSKVRKSESRSTGPALQST